MAASSLLRNINLVKQSDPGQDEASSSSSSEGTACSSLQLQLLSVARVHEAMAEGLAGGDTSEQPGQLAGYRDAADWRRCTQSQIALRQSPIMLCLGCTAVQTSCLHTAVVQSAAMCGAAGTHRNTETTLVSHASSDASQLSATLFSHC